MRQLNKQLAELASVEKPLTVVWRRVLLSARCFSSAEPIHRRNWRSVRIEGLHRISLCGATTCENHEASKWQGNSGVHHDFLLGALSRSPKPHTGPKSRNARRFAVPA